MQLHLSLSWSKCLLWLARFNSDRCKIVFVSFMSWKKNFKAQQSHNFQGESIPWTWGKNSFPLHRRRELHSVFRKEDGGDTEQCHGGAKRQNNLAETFNHRLSWIVSFAITEQTVNYESHWEDGGGGIIVTQRPGNAVDGRRRVEHHDTLLLMGVD